MKGRFLLLMGFLALVVTLWVLYLFCVQVLDLPQLDYLRQLRYNPVKEILIPTRGAIYDRNGKLLVSSLKFYQVDIDRSSIKKYCERNHKDLNVVYSDIANIFAKHTPITREFVLKKLHQPSLGNSVVISRKIKESELEWLIAEFHGLSNDKRKLKKYPGLIASFSSMKRIYSKGLLGARLLGAVKENSEEIARIRKDRSIYRLTGICGIEASYDNYLAGEYGWREAIYDANNRRVPYPNLRDKAPINGNDLYLTIDADIQELVEKNLREGLEKYQAKNAAAIVMDVKTGEILAMAGISATDNSIDPQNVRALPNIPVTFNFEPGSTYKPFTALVALENKSIGLNEKIDCSTLITGRRRISDTHHYGMLDLRNIIAYSSNVGISKVADRVGAKALYSRLISLGFGQRSGINLAGESSGFFPKLNHWDGYSLHSISFGQSISVTAIQLANAYCTLSNGGKIMKPLLVREIRSPENVMMEKYEPRIVRSLRDPVALDTLKSYMKCVVDYGTATSVKLDYLDIAGKTGTAEKKDENGRGYASYKYTSVFAGFFPVDEPRLVVLTAYDEPAYAYHFGSMSAGPTFKAIVEQLVSLPNCDIIPHIKEKKQQYVSMPTVLGMHQSQAEATLHRIGIQVNTVVTDPSGVVVNQFPKPNVSFDRKNSVTIVVDKKTQTTAVVTKGSEMPNLVGMSVRKAVQVAKSKRLALTVKGIGVVCQQSIPAGSSIKYGESCIVEAR